jgi:prolyl oligopeptidase
MTINRRFLLSGLPVLIAVALVATARGSGGPPSAEKRPVADEYHGVKVVDDYRWLEKWEDPRVQAWSNAQNAYARSVLDTLPGVSAIRKRVTELHGAEIHYAGVTWRAGGLLALKYQSGKDQPSLVALTGPNDVSSERVVVDLLALNPKGSVSIDWYVASPDGALLAASLSEGGSERGSVHVYDTKTGKALADVVPGVNYGTAGGSLAWAPDSSGFYYTRYPHAGERPAADLDFYTEVYFHRLGTPIDRDRYEIGKDFPRIAEIQLRANPTSGRLIANVANGDGGEFEQFLRLPSGRWVQLSTFKDKVLTAILGKDSSLYLLSRNGAPHGKLLRLNVAADANPRLADATVIVPEVQDGVIAFDFAGVDTIVVTQSRLFVVDLVGGPNRVRMFTPTGASLGTLAVPPVSAIMALVPFGRDGVLYKTATFTEPPAWYEFNPATDRGAAPRGKSAISSTASAQFGDTEVVREMVRSKDGTQVPLNIIRRKGVVLNGTNPTLLYGYGGYSSSLTPFFLDATRLWLDHGGVFAAANLRGGGEFGEEWHLSGNLTKKQNVFDDFIACAEYLVRTGYTTPARLAIEGGSNGGLLMGAAMTQRPDLFKAVVSHVGIYDMLRVELSPNGAFNTTEFGTVKDRAQFAAMYAYSPYHHVTPGTKYPATLFLTGANDPRVDPMQSRKMTARLQAATAGTGKILLRTSAGSGHGFGTALSEVIEQEVDVYAFLFNEMGISPVAPVRAAATSGP